MRSFKFVFNFASKNQKQNQNVPFLIQQSQKTKQLKLSSEQKSLNRSNIHQQTNQDHLNDNRVQDVYKKMDSSLEGFFYKRSFTLQNFNFLLQILAEQNKLQQALKVVEKMNELNIKPNKSTFNFLIKACAKANDSVNAEIFFQEAKLKGLANLQTYNSLINVYTRKKEFQICEKIVQEIIDNGMVPDTPIYTTLINSYFKAGQIQKCWEIYDNQVTGFTELESDEILTGLMIEICAHTHDAEKALNLFRDLESKGFQQTCLPYNAIIKALGSRKDYAQDAIETYHKMTNSQIIADQDTYIHLLKACANLGDIKTAYNAIIAMKQQGLKVNRFVYNQMIRVYAGAISLDYQSESTKELYINDSWRLLEQAIKEKEVNINVLNSMVLLMAKALRPEQIQGLVLPLYNQLNINMDAFTYQHIMEMYSKLQDIGQVFKLYEQCEQSNIEPNFYILCYYLDGAIKIQDEEKVLKALKNFQKIQREPYLTHLKTLGESKELPKSIYDELFHFKNKFGKVKRYAKKSPQQEDESLEQYV